MKIKTNNSNFEPCPEFTGKAVCVDVTPLRKQQSQFGEREVFKLVFEVDLERDDGSRFSPITTDLSFTDRGALTNHSSFYRLRQY